MTDVSDVRTASIIIIIIIIITLMMGAVRTSETSINFNVPTRRYSKLHSRRRENLKSQKILSPPTN
jgi:hypothetical protein